LGLNWFFDTHVLHVFFTARANEFILTRRVKARVKHIVTFLLRLLASTARTLDSVPRIIIPYLLQNEFVGIDLRIRDTPVLSIQVLP